MNGLTHVFGVAGKHSQEVRNCPCVGGARFVYKPTATSKSSQFSKPIIQVSVLLQCSLETIIGLVHVELKLPRLLVIKLL